MSSGFAASSPCLTTRTSSSAMRSSSTRARSRAGVPTSMSTSVASPTMTCDPWYESVGPGERLTQGDIIFDCPLVSWSATPIRVAGSNRKSRRSSKDASPSRRMSS